MVVRMNHNRGQKGRRRSHIKITTPQFAACSSCNAATVRHRACANCGTYRGRQVIDVAKKQAKIEKKQKERENAQ